MGNLTLLDLMAIAKNSDVYPMLQYKILVGIGVPRLSQNIEIYPRPWHVISQDLPGLTVGADLRVRPNEGRRIALPLLGWSVVARGWCIREFRDTFSLPVHSIDIIDYSEYVPARRHGTHQYP
jgi:hypothetical protein